MNKVTQTLRHMGKGKFTMRQIFDAQQSAIDAITDDKYYEGYDAILRSHGLTREQWFAIIHDPALYSFYSPGLPKEYEPLNAEVRRYSRSKGFFTPDYTTNMFSTHLSRAVRMGQVTFEGRNGHRLYYLTPTKGS